MAARRKKSPPPAPASVPSTIVPAVASTTLARAAPPPPPRAARPTGHDHTQKPPAAAVLRIDSHTCAPSAARIVSFRYGGTVTVPGVGGRARKWRSDADRIRAFRARRAGRQEPPTLDAALRDGDELALALVRETELRTELDVARQQIERARSQIAELRAECVLLKRTSSERAREPKNLQRRVEWHAPVGEPLPDAETPPPPLLNRAARRRLERERQRRSRGS